MVFMATKKTAKKEAEKEVKKAVKPAEPEKKTVKKAPAKKAEAPKKKTEAPKKKTEAPKKKTEATKKKAEAPKKKAEAPEKKQEAPKEPETPKRKVDGYPAKVVELVGRTGVRGEIIQVRCEVLEGQDAGKVLIRNVKSPVWLGDILLLAETAMQARKLEARR